VGGIGESYQGGESLPGVQTVEVAELVVTHIISTSYPQRSKEHWKEHQMQHLQLGQKIRHAHDMMR
jgi:hypothetical protein